MRKYVWLLVLGSAQTLFYQNCSQNQFGAISDADKQATLVKSSVFASAADEIGRTNIPTSSNDDSGRTNIPTSGGGGPGGSNIPTNGGGPGGSNIPTMGGGPGGSNIPTNGGGPGGSNIPTNGGSAQTSIPVVLECGTDAKYVNNSLMGIGRNNFKVQVESADGKNVDQTCAAASVFDDLVNTHKLNAANLCPGLTLPDGNYRFNVGRYGREDELLAVYGRRVNGQFLLSSGQRGIDYRQLTASEYAAYRANVNVLPEDCDKKMSPLVIRLNSSETHEVRLTAPTDGVLFDIMGQAADPAPHTPKLISWLADAQTYYLVLPDRLGRVKGIDQLFGDQTVGPDGRNAANGYDALAKYDGMSADGRERVADADQMITAADPVFKKLRLWQDRNLDGIAQAKELMTLDSKSITVIDLRYDANYIERDRYGNEARYKSVVQTSDGKLHLFFDIWFRVMDPKLKKAQPMILRSVAGERG